MDEAKPKPPTDELPLQTGPATPIEKQTAAPAPVTLAPAAAPLAGAKPPVPKSQLIEMTGKGVQLKTIEEVFLFSQALIRSGMAPKGLDTQEKIFIVVQFGLELGLSPMAACQNISCINNRPTVWGDAVPGLCAPLIEDYKDEEIGEQGKDSWGFKVTVKRKGRASPVVRSFTVADAKAAHLWGKRGAAGGETPWITHPGRMLLMRARTFAFRDACPDALRGLLTVEEARELPEEPMKNVTGSAKLDAIDGGTTL
jgi:hypothetical protein